MTSLPCESVRVGDREPRRVNGVFAAANGACAASAMESQGVVPLAHRASYVQRFRLSSDDSTKRQKP